MPKTMKGGDVLKNSALRRIISIGYEFECGDMFVTNLDGNTGKFLIPEEYNVEELLHDKSCVEVGDYTCILSSETDTPHASNITNSLLNDFEQLLIHREDDFKALLDKSNFYMESSEGADIDDIIPNLPITHTEFLFTLFHKDNKCNSLKNGPSYTEHPLNDDDCILHTFKAILSMMEIYFLPATELFPNEDVPNEISYKDSIISYYRPNPDFNIGKQLYYGIPAKLTTDILTPQNIKWVPQMTYCVAVEDIIVVSLQLAKYLHSEEIEIITDCITNAQRLMQHVNFRNKLKETFKNMLFFAVYYYHTYYFYTETKLNRNKLRKNMYCFLFRHSIHEMIEYYWSIDEASVIEIQEALEKNIIVDDEDINDDDTQVMRFNKLLSYVSRHVYITVEDLKKQDKREYGIFSKIFEEESNYYPFNGVHVLIEYRCFARNLIKSINISDRKKPDSEIPIHRTLDEWNILVSKLDSIKSVQKKSATKSAKKSVKKTVKKSTKKSSKKM